MLEIFKELTIAIGGGTVALVGLLTIFKKLFLKMFETGIDATFEKNIQKHKNSLERTTKAYEILLEREMRFYEHIDPLFAELIPVLNDLKDISSAHKKFENGVIDEVYQINTFRTNLLKYLDIIKSIKNEVLLNQSYIPTDMFLTFTELINEMQRNLEFWHNTFILLNNKEIDKLNYNDAEKIVSNIFEIYTECHLTIKNRLNDLSEI